jgi:hypothetical protein
MHRRPARHGVSLLEVLISIGVTAIGLLGVLALIPLAGAQALKGEVSDRMAVIGNSGVSELRARGGLNPKLWVYKNGVSANEISTKRPKAICLDPRGVAQTIDTAFPALPGGAQMDRLSLDNLLGAAPPANVLSRSAADYIFMSQDDLALTNPPDKSLPPGQRWQPDEGVANPSRRQFGGSMSWMVTIWPRWEGDEIADGQAPQRDRDLYLCPIVVFHRRVVGDEVSTPVVANSNMMFSGGGIAGGDATLTFADANQAKLATTPEDTWLLISGQLPVIPNQPTPSYPIFRWYRVIASDPDPDPSTLKRYVTLDGADWNMAATNVRATIIPGTVGVFEKVVKLETSSLWSV